MDAKGRKERPLTGRGHLGFLSNSKRQAVRRAVDCQRDYQCRSNLTKMFGRLSIKMAGSARGTNVMNVFADEEKERISGCGRQYHRPPWAIVQAFRQNREEGHTKQCAGRETDQCAERPVSQAKRSANQPATNRERVGHCDLPESDLAVQDLAAPAVAG